MNLVRVVLRNVVQVQLEQEVMLLQSAEHAGKSAGLAVHSAEGRHADLTGLMAGGRRGTREARRLLNGDQRSTRYVPDVVHQQDGAIRHHGKVGGVQVG